MLGPELRRRFSGKQKRTKKIKKHHRADARRSPGPVADSLLVNQRLRIRAADSVQHESIGGEDRSLDAGPAIVPVAVFHSHGGYTTKAGTEAAGHRRFEREPAGDVGGTAQSGGGVHHRLGPTTV